MLQTSILSNPFRALPAEAIRASEFHAVADEARNLAAVVMSGQPGAVAAVAEFFAELVEPAFADVGDASLDAWLETERMFLTVINGGATEDDLAALSDRLSDMAGYFTDKAEG